MVSPGEDLESVQFNDFVKRPVPLQRNRFSYKMLLIQVYIVTWNIKHLLFVSAPHQFASTLLGEG